MSGISTSNSGEPIHDSKRTDSLLKPCALCLTTNGLSLMRAARSIEENLGLPCLATSKGLKSAWRDIQAVIYKLQMYQLAHDDEDHEIAAVAVCWSRLCSDTLVRDVVVTNKPFREGIIKMIRHDRCEFSIIAGLYLFTVLCRQINERSSFEVASFGMRGATRVFQQFLRLLSTRPQSLVNDLIVENAVSFFAADFSSVASRDPTLGGDSRTTVLVALVEILPTTTAPAVFGLMDLIIDNAHAVDDLEADENRPLLLFLLGVLNYGGPHTKLRVLRLLENCRAAREADKRRPWSPARFLRVMKEDAFDDVQRTVFGSDAQTRARFVRVLNAGADIMRAFAVHRNLFTVAILWWQLVYEEPRCLHFDPACGRRFGYGTRSPRACGFPFSSWQETFLHCAAVLRATPFESIQPHIFAYSSCVSPDDVADVLQIQYHLALNQLAEAEALVASARARNPREVWFLYALSELDEPSALSALDILAEGVRPGELCDPGFPIVDRIMRNCYKWVYWDLARGLDSRDFLVIFPKLRKFLGIFRDKVNLGGIPLDSPDRGWSVSFHAIMSTLYAIPQRSNNSELLQSIDDVTDYLYGDLSDHPRWITRVIHQYTAQASETWEKLLTIVFRDDDWSRVGVGRELLRISHERTFERAELIEWNRRVFDPRQEEGDLSWKAVPKRVWENLVHPALRPADITERCRHCNVPSMLLRRYSLCREVKYCGIDCQQKSWALEHKTTCLRNHLPRPPG